MGILPAVLADQEFAVEAMLSPPQTLNAEPPDFFHGFPLVGLKVLPILCYSFLHERNDPLTFPSEMNPSEYQPREFLWSQRDLRWAKKLLGASLLDCGHYGCASLCVTYVVDRRRDELGKGFLYPSEVIQKSNYTPGGAIYWNSAEVLSGNRLKQSGKTGANYTLMEVVWGVYHHWVVLLDGDLCYDPWSGTVIKRVQPQWYPSGKYIYYKKV